MTYEVKDGIRIDDLGYETKFIIPINDASESIFNCFEAMLYRTIGKGFHLSYGHGGWEHPPTELCAIYDIAQLSEDHRNAFIRWLLKHTKSTNLYVVLPGGMAKGYSYTNEPDTKTSPLMNTAPGFTGKPDVPGVIGPTYLLKGKKSDKSYASTLHGVRDTGWPHK